MTHAHLAGSLPLHHGDPFDRILIAQAQLEGFTIVTRDPAFKAYGVPLLMA
jgi:PIN domain nuclease of toxin-antitoxin system